MLSSKLNDFRKLLRVSSEAPFVDWRKPLAADLGTYFLEAELRGREEARMVSAPDLRTVLRRLLSPLASDDSLQLEDSVDVPRTREGTGGTSESESSGLDDAQNEDRLFFDLVLLADDLIEAAPRLRRLSAGSVDVEGFVDADTLTGTAGKGGIASTGAFLSLENHDGFLRSSR